MQSLVLLFKNALEPYLDPEKCVLSKCCFQISSISIPQVQAATLPLDFGRYTDKLIADDIHTSSNETEIKNEVYFLVCYKFVSRNV